MVGLFGFEPKTSSMSTKRSNQLSYNPMSDENIIHDGGEICKRFLQLLFLRRMIGGETHYFNRKTRLMAGFVVGLSGFEPETSSM